MCNPQLRSSGTIHIVDDPAVAVGDAALLAIAIEAGQIDDG